MKLCPAIKISYLGTAPERMKNANADTRSHINECKKINYTGRSSSHKDSGGCLLLEESLSRNVYKVFGVFLPDAQKKKKKSVHTNTLPH